MSGAGDEKGDDADVSLKNPYITTTASMDAVAAAELDHNGVALAQQKKAYVVTLSPLWKSPRRILNRILCVCL